MALSLFLSACELFDDAYASSSHAYSHVLMEMACADLYLSGRSRSASATLTVLPQVPPRVYYALLAPTTMQLVRL